MQENIAPHYEQWEHEGIMPRSVWNALVKMAFFGVDVPEEYGGYGVPIHYSLMLVEESARAGFLCISDSYFMPFRNCRRIFWTLVQKNKAVLVAEDG